MICVARVLASIALLAMSTAPLLGAPPAAGRDARQAEAQHRPTAIPVARPCPPRGAQSDAQTSRAKPAKGGRGRKDADGYGDAYYSARELQAEVARINAQLVCDEATGDHGARGMWDSIDRPEGDRVKGDGGNRAVSDDD